MKRLWLFIMLFYFVVMGNSQSNWQLSVQTWTFHKYSLLETIDKIDSLEIKNLEVYPGQRVGEGYHGPFSYNLNKRERTRLKKYLQKKGIKIIALGVVDKEYYNHENLELFFIFCKDMGIPFLTAEPETADLDLFNQLAEKYKVKVALHCHPKPYSHYWHPDSTVVAMKGRKNIGAWPDIGHWSRNGVNAVDGLKKMDGKLRGLHFKDVNKFDDVNAADTLHGKGVSDLSGVLKELKRQNFNGVISMEYEAHEDNNMDDMRKNIGFYKSEIKKLK